MCPQNHWQIRNRKLHNPQIWTRISLRISFCNCWLLPTRTWQLQRRWKWWCCDPSTRYQRLSSTELRPSPPAPRTRHYIYAALSMTVVTLFSPWVATHTTRTASVRREIISHGSIWCRLTASRPWLYLPIRVRIGFGSITPPWWPWA